MDGLTPAGGVQGAAVPAPHGTVTTAKVLEGEADGRFASAGGPVDLAALVVAQQDVIDRLVTLHRDLRSTVADLTRRVRALETGPVAPPAAQGRG